METNVKDARWAIRLARPMPEGLGRSALDADSQHNSEGVDCYVQSRYAIALSAVIDAPASLIESKQTLQLSAMAAGAQMPAGRRRSMREGHAPDGWEHPACHQHRF